jgi:hypothetical protein
MSVLPDNTPVWRYLNLSAVIATIKTRKLRLTRLDTFKDPFEGSVPKKQMEEQDLLLIGAESRRNMMNAVAAHHPGMPSVMPPDEDAWARITRLRRARTRAAHASCWSYGEESEALWRLYCTDDGNKGVGVALRTTLDRLTASVATHGLCVSPITYVKYHEAPAFTDDMQPLLHKRHGFRAEQELRLLKFDQAHYDALIPKDSSKPALLEHIYLDWPLSNVIKELVISPYADSNYQDLVCIAVNATDSSLTARVILSELHERRYKPNF